jgi:hypothetical protein
MNVNDMYRICQYAINKAQNGYLTSSEFNLLVNQAQTSYVDYLLGEFQQYQYGKAQARIDYNQNSNIRQRLSPLIYGQTLTVDANGFSSYPSDYIQTDALWHPNGIARYRYVKQDSLFSYYNSKIDPIASNPIYLIEQTGFRFYPASVGSARLTYVKNPPTITWGYTLDANNREIYSPAASTQPVWSDVDLLEIIARVLKLVGVNLKDGMVAQYANQVTQMGQ